MWIQVPHGTQVAKWGNSLAIRIPQDLVRQARLAEGDRLSLDLAGDGSIILRPRRRKYSLDALVARIRPVNRHHESDWGAPKGEEERRTPRRA